MRAVSDSDHAAQWRDRLPALPAEGVPIVTFLAQLYGVDMTFADRLSVTLLAALLSVGVPGSCQP